jgi:maleate isomerase
VKLPFVLDDGAAADAALGLVVLQNDETLEPELRTIFNDRAGALYHTRIASAEVVTPETLKAMERDLPRALALLPTARPLDVVGYACTSGATLIGQDRVAEIISSVHPHCFGTNPISAALAACGHLGVRRLAFITPYVPDVSSAMHRLLESNGLEIAGFASFEQSQEAVVARISPQSVLEAICTVGRNEDVEAVFASCTNLRTFEILDAAEARIQKPVISSNAALAWHMRRLAGLGPPQDAPGRLLRS